MDIDTLEVLVEYYTRVLNENWSRSVELEFFQRLKGHSYGARTGLGDGNGNEGHSFQDVYHTMKPIKSTYSPLKNYIKWCYNNCDEDILTTIEHSRDDIPTAVCDALLELLDDRLEYGKDTGDLEYTCEQLTEDGWMNFAKGVVTNADDSFLQESLDYDLGVDEDNYGRQAITFADYILEAHVRAPHRVSTIVKILSVLGYNLEGVFFLYLHETDDYNGLFRRVIVPYLDIRVLEEVLMTAYGDKEHGTFKRVLLAGRLEDV